MQRVLECSVQGLAKLCISPPAMEPGLAAFCGSDTQMQYGGQSPESKMNLA